MKKRIITLLLAILTIVIGGAYAQTKIKVHKGDEVIYSVPLTDVDSVGFAKVTSSVHNGHEFVDLGLPSGTKWATCNVGATTPEGYGDYFAWGETEPNTIYDWTTYKYCDGSGSRITKYATGYSYSNAPDGLTELEMTDDAAYINWGGSWRIPTEEEMTELINNCNWTWVTQNGVNGYKVTSTVNGNSIFLPATSAIGDGYVSNQEYAYYWTNSIRSIVNNSANALYYLNAYAPSSTGNLTRCTGASVRAVCNIDGGYTQTKVSIYKEDDVIYSRPIAEIDSIKFETEYSGISTEGYYRIKNVETGLYLNAVNYDFHYTGSFGGVNCTAYAQDADQIFKFELSGDKFKVITNSGYYLYCQQWIVDAQTAGVDLSFIKNDDETYDIMFGESYFAVDEVNGYYYPFCNATEGEKATWVLEEATPLPTYTVSVSATEGGTATASASSMAKGGSITLIATPATGYRFVNWTVGGVEVSTESIYVATITVNTQFVANFEERTTDTGISLTKEYRIKHVESGNYLNASNNLTHIGGTNGGVNCVAYAENNNQIFVFEASGTNYYLKSKSGYYIYCQQWNVDALTTGTELTFIDNPDGTYYIKNGANYFKVEDVNGVYYPFCDAPADLRATWVLEPVGGEEPEPTPTYTVAVSATQGGTVTTSAESVEEGGSVILTATPETGYRFVNWTLNNNVVSVSNPFIATITANSEFVANFEAEETEHEYVDLGLSVNWATCNVGANTPEEYGDYFAWGETSPKDNYYWSNYKYCYGDRYSMTKYCVDSEYGIVDNKTTLEPEDDAARVNWGGEWRMPTKAEQDELRNTDNCTWTWTTQNGVNGYKVTSKKNGNSIFLPAAGCRYESNLDSAGSDGLYWSSSLDTSMSGWACYLDFRSSGVYWGVIDRYYGLSVRPVCDSSTPAPTYTVAVSSTIGGTATASAESIKEGGSVTLTATANSGYVFKNWTLGGEVVSTENPYTATVTANSEFVANFEAEENQSGELHNGHEYIDLGLPSGLKWATCNVGATTPEEYGNNYAWGETTPQSWLATEYTYNDNPEVLPLSADAANVNWGGNWRMPTKAEQEELMDTDNCTWEWTTQNEVNGYKVTSKKNGNSIFLPGAANSGYYWSSSAYPGSTSYAYCLMFTSVSVNCDYSQRNYGQSVRAVFGEKQTFTVSVSAGTGGSATASALEVEQGGSVTLTATANSGYVFKNWTLGGEVVSTENPYTTTINANSEYVANFEKITYTVSVSSTTGGSATASAESVEGGGSVTLTATPNEGYQFLNWTLNGEVVSTDNPYTTTINANSEYVANFEEIVKYNVTASVNNPDMGSATASAESVEQGGSVTLTATANSGYLFKNWTLGGEVVSTENPYTATITANSEFVANFEEEVSDSGISLTKGYRIKHVESGMYLNVENIDEHTGGTNGGVNCVAYAISNNQIFSFEAVGSNFYLKSKSGYYIYCQDWNVDALSKKTALTFTENEDGTYYILNGSKYFKVEQVNGTYYPFGDAPADLRATWVLEEAIETPPTTAVYNGHEYIDLGLPSGIKWATCNVGATTPAEYGDYFAWGETEPKDFYNWNTYKHCVENGDYYSVNSYCPNSDIGVEDNRTILDAEDDAASANWGGSWRMPTKKEQEELINNCIWEWTGQNGKSGYKIISKINGNSIFLPAAGFFLDGNAQPGNCNYWSSSVRIDHNSSAACLITDSSNYEYRNYGQSVRAVFGENNEVGTICSVSASATEGGSATASALEVEGGGSVTLTATPDEGYVFKNWTLGGEVVSTENPYTATVTANSEYVANFEEIVKYNVTASVNNSDMGSATASASSIDGGGSVTLTATANSGYLFKNWTLGGEVVSTENPYTATITANSEFVANFEEIVVSGAAISLTQYFRIKDINSGKYLNADNYEAHTGGTNGGVNCIDYADSDDQKFMFEASSDTNFSLKTKSGYYIYCQAWNVDALTSGTVLTFEENGNGAYYIKTSDGYFKVEQVNGTYYPFCGASSLKKATWILEETGEATNQVIPTFTVEAKANTGGSATTSATTVAYGESVTLTATPNTEYGYIFNYWSKTGKGQVSTENPYSPIITANSQFYANFKKAVYTVSVSATEGGTATTSAESVEHGTYITLTATPDEGYVFKCWTLNGEIVSVKSSYGTTANANSEFVANFIKYADEVTGSENGHDYVDLGLPSGTRWATCNVGATTPEGKGSYFAWGETTPKTTFDEVTYKYYGGDVSTKYLLDPADGWLDDGDDEQFIDNKIALFASDDAATVNWGGKWRMPTKAEAKELVDYCTWTSWTQNGVSGYKVTSNINGNSIFLPKAGGYVGTDGAFYSNGWYYWTSSLDINSNNAAYSMKGNAITAYDRYRGLTIRAVCPAKGEGAPSIIVGVSSSSGGKASVSSNSVAKNGTVFLTATPNNGYAFKNWTLDGEVVSTESTYTATVTANSSSYRHYVANFEDVSGKVHEYVDLGLSVKWATYNVGATDIYDKGDKFAWGETEVKNYYKWGTYKYAATGSWSYLKRITKYSTSRAGTYGPADGKDTLEPEDDAATVNWGGNWRMPTKHELKELYENCTWARTVKNGIYVVEGTSKINGNTIYFILNESSLTMSLWSSSLPENVTADGSDYENARDAVSLYFSPGNSFSGMYYDEDRCNGFYVRAVCE